MTEQAEVTKGGSNSNLHSARRARNDEFYTRIEDVEAELWNYREHFRGKAVYLNCDDPRWSAFWRYFCLQFDTLGLQRLIATHYTGVVNPGTPSFMVDVVRGRDVTDPQRIDPETVGVRRALAGDGDFRSEECVALLEQADVVVTNPPFSLFREYVAQLVAYGKKFVILGNMNAITYKEVWPLIESGKMWLGVTGFNNGMYFAVSDEWEYSATWKRYTPEEYPKYDNYDAINVNKVKDIPQDYDGAIGVPITFLDKWNPDQFEIVTRNGFDDVPHQLVLRDNKVYARIFIRRVISS